MKYDNINLHPNAIDISGNTYSMLKVIKPVGRFNDRKVKWLCVCECGEYAVTSVVKLKSGHTKSCGCFKVIATKKAKTTHGRSKSTEYGIWNGMKNRCENKNEPAYRRYGGKGISVCERWQKFTNFHEDMGDRPSPIHSIDRIDGTKGYYKENCRWATPLEQANNQSTNRPLTLNGRTQNLSTWAREIGIAAASLSSRLNRSRWSVEKALTTDKNGNRIPPLD